MTKETKIIAGVLAGVALGAVVVLALSNDKSDDLKEKISDWFCDLLDSSKEKLTELTDSVKDKIADIKA